MEKYGLTKQQSERMLKYYNVFSLFKTENAEAAQENDPYKALPDWEEVTPEEREGRTRGQLKDERKRPLTSGSSSATRRLE